MSSHLRQRIARCWPRLALMGLALLGAQQQALAADEAACTLPKRLSGQVLLDGSCTYRQQITLSSSDTTLDCRGAILDGENRLAVGIMIDSEGRPLSQVTVRNCAIRNFTANAVRIAWAGADNEKPTDRAERRQRTPRQVLLSNLKISNIGRVGVYFDDFVSDSTLENSVIADSAGVGLYLEFDSQNNTISHNEFRHNGHPLKREALAVDSSSRNTIVENTFVENRLGGIFLYKNCGEHVSSGHSVPRTQHSEDNLITKNRFIREDVGIWIASRQSRNLQKIDCSDPPMDARGQYFEDFANRNTVEQNVFCSTAVGVRIEGDENRIRGNYFDDRTAQRVEIPKTKRGELLGRPPMGNQYDAGRDGNSLCSKF